MRGIWLVAVLTVAASSVAAQEKKVIQTPGSITGLPFSSAIRVGDVLYLSGQIGVVSGSRQPVPGGTAAEVRQTLENIKQVVEHAGSSMDRVFKCTVFLADMADFAAMNEVYSTFFPKDPPARSTVAVKGLAFGARTEIECIALAGK